MQPLSVAWLAVVVRDDERAANKYNKNSQKLLAAYNIT
jgi:hypothetical protein